LLRLSWASVDEYIEHTDDERADGLEKCFITPSEHRSGLTISGFYYVSLRRDNGQIEGLYYDPSSSPYQHLTLTPEKRGFPVYEFR
jgi:hypothetical protein